MNRQHPDPASISVVIPNYNGEQLLRQNLPLLYRALAHSGVRYEVIIPDDASTDNSVAFLERHYPDIRVIRHEQNQGFASNINSGIRAARLELVFLLNSDIALTPEYFAPLLPYFDDPQTFGVAGRILAMDADTVQDAAKYPDYYFGRIRSTLNFELTNPAPGMKVPTFFMSGANILAHRQKLLELGGFNEHFSPFYSEDVDLGLRAWRLGYACYYEHRAVCRHPNSVTIRKYNSNRKVRIIAKRNKFYLHYLHLDGLEQQFWFCKLMLQTLGRLLALDGKHLASVRQFLQHRSLIAGDKARFARLQQQRGVQLSLRDIRRHILRKIGDQPINRF